MNKYNYLGSFSDSYIGSILFIVPLRRFIAFIWCRFITFNILCELTTSSLNIDQGRETNKHIRQSVYQTSSMHTRSYFQHQRIQTHKKMSYRKSEQTLVCSLSRISCFDVGSLLSLHSQRRQSSMHIRSYHQHQRIWFSLYLLRIYTHFISQNKSSKSWYEMDINSQ